MRRSYFELMELPTFEERFEYLQIQSAIGDETFGYERSLNQKFYTSKEWRDIRSHVIYRDRGLDMGLDGFEISGRIYIHHMNPMRPEDLYNSQARILDPEYLIAVSHPTHNAIHFGDVAQVPTPYAPRTKGDTLLW